MSVQAIGAAADRANPVGRGDSPKSRLEKELSHAAQSIGLMDEVLHGEENEKASPQPFCLRAAPTGPTAAGGRHASPAVSAAVVARGDPAQPLGPAAQLFVWSVADLDADLQPVSRRCMVF